MDTSITIVEYSKAYAKSITEDLFKGVPEIVIIEQREELLRPGPEEVFSVCAIHADQVIGVCTGVRMRWVGSRHRIEMVQVVVNQNFRRRGVAKLMMQKISEHFSSRGVEIVQISTESSNKDAILAYERIGFQRFGMLNDGIKHNDQYADEVLMSVSIEMLIQS